VVYDLSGALGGVKMAVKPFLKWAGGKRWLVRKYKSCFPEDIGCYYEPFLGSGAVFFALCPGQGVISDSNRELIDVYKALKRDWRQVYGWLYEFSNRHSFEGYYAIRSSCPETIYERAARFIYLNRACWNGLYRVNKKGEFNVPKGTKDKILLATDDWEGISLALQNVKVREADYLQVLDNVQRNDFVFLDPPYTIKTKEFFVRYNQVGFPWERQIELCDAATRAMGRGAKVMVTHKANECVKRLYEDAGFHVRTISRTSVISAAPERRGRYDELLIRSWE